MYVEYSGWTETSGSFHYSIFINEASTEYEIEYANGFVAKQTSIFKSFTLDWNHDGDVYTQFGAWFKSRHGGEDFYTPEDMVRSLVDSVTEEDTDNRDRVIAIKGIELPADLTGPAMKRKGR